MSGGFPECSDTTDIRPFYEKANLYLKPLQKIYVSVQLPKLKPTGQAISNKSFIEDIKKWAAPDCFSTVKVSKTTLEVVRFEAELERAGRAGAVLPRINGRTIPLKGYSESARVRASIAKHDFPARHDWDSFFSDAKNMNELKAGERPDTMHLCDLPVAWFSSDSGKPSESLLTRIFEQFGTVTAVDVPSNDPYRTKTNSQCSDIKQFGSMETFEAYVQFREYMSFVSAMDALRGMKLLLKRGTEAFTAVIKVNFDKTKHLSENSIRKRKLHAEKILARQRLLEEQQMAMEEAETHKKRKDETEAKVIKKIMKEEKLLLVAQKKLESIRLLDKLLKKIEANKKILDRKKRKEKRRRDSEKTVVSLLTEANMKDREIELRERLLHKVKNGVKSNSSNDSNWIPSEVVKITNSNKSKNDVNEEEHQGWHSKDLKVCGSVAYSQTHRLYYKYFKKLVDPSKCNDRRKK